MFSGWFKPSVALGGNDKIVTCTISEITQESPDTKLFKFALPDKKSVLGLLPGQHMRITTEIDGKDVFRTYTPVRYQTPGEFECVIKVYKEGVITQYLDGLTVGSDVKIYGPIGMIKVENNIYKKVSGEEVLADKPKKIGMIAGGSGITPMIQLVNSTEKDCKDVSFKLIFSNKTVGDIICRKELESYGEKLEILNTITRENEVPEGFSKGRINAEMVKEFLDADTDVIAICGPPEFTAVAKEICEGLFEGYSFMGGKSGAFMFKK